MKLIIIAFAAVAVGSLSLNAQGNKPGTGTQPGVDSSRTDTDRSRNTDRSVTETTTTTTFNPESRTKVVKFFEAHKTQPHGLPVGLAKKINVKEMPMAWKTTRITPGITIQENQLQYLVEAPDDLVEVLPDAPSGVKYYIAGSNVVAVETTTYRIVDSVQIPSIKFQVED